MGDNLLNLEVVKSEQEALYNLLSNGNLLVENVSLNRIKEVVNKLYISEITKLREDGFNFLNEINKII